MYLQTKSNDAKPMPIHWVEALFKRMLARYGSLWQDRYGRLGLDMADIMHEWSIELAGFSGQEIARGLDGCRTLKFPPTLPEFMLLCRPPIDAHAAFSETVRNLAARARGDDSEWSHPALFWAALAVGQFDLMGTSYPNIKTRWEAALQEEMNRTDIKPVPPAMKALPAPQGEVNHEALAMLRGLVGKLKVRA